jgi:hypothetical protein
MSLSDPWRLIAVAVALVTATSLLTAVVAWTTSEFEWRVDASTLEALRSASFRMAVVAPQASAMATPPRSAIATCHRQASRPQSEGPQPEALKAGMLGTGSLYGLSQDQRRNERYRAAYARCMRSRGYSS